MKASDWISVKDRLPRANKEVLVTCSAGKDRWVRLATIVKNELKEPEWFADDGWQLNPYDITHWQHIVLPKKEKE